MPSRRRSKLTYILTAERERHARELAATRASAEQAAKQKVEREAFLKADVNEEKQRNTRLLSQLKELTGEIRALKRKDEERDLEYKQKLAADEEHIRAETRKNVAEEFRLKDLEKDKRPADALRQLEDLKSKMQQGSQQTQGEVLELELEELLRQEFKEDEIAEVKKGQRGGIATSGSEGGEPAAPGQTVPSARSGLADRDRGCGKEIIARTGLPAFMPWISAAGFAVSDRRGITTSSSAAAQRYRSGAGSAPVFFSMSFIISISILVARKLAPADSLTS